MDFDRLSEHAKHALDAAAIATAFGTLVNMLPAIAAGLSIIWSAIRIWETDTVKRWTGRGE